MKFFKSKPVIHHFKLNFPLPSTNVQSCVSKIQNLTTENTEAIFFSLNGICSELQTAQTLNNAFQITNDKWKIPVYTFLQENTTSLTYLASTCGIISANPYCVIGDIGTAQKSYTNIEKLLSFLNIKIDLVSCHQQRMPWNSLTKPDQSEAEISKKWLDAVQQAMIKTVSERRRLPMQTLRTLKSKLLTPKQALGNKLIDYIQTAQQFKQTHYPQVKVQQHVFIKPAPQVTISETQIKLLTQIQQILTMPKVAMFSLQDPVNQCIRDLTDMIKQRMETPEQLEELDTILGEVFKQFQIKMQQNGGKYMLL